MKTKILGYKQAKAVLKDERSMLALIIGNGINHASQNTGGIKWDDLMQELIEHAAKASPKPDEARERLCRLIKKNSRGNKAASLPEVFDIIDATGNLKPGSSMPRTGDADLQKRIADLLTGMRPGDTHAAVMSWAQTTNVPVMTTNYDHCLQEAMSPAKCPQRRFGVGRAKSDFYPWDRYYSPVKIDDPLNSFAVWHVHGDQALKRSIRAGLDQYMGMVQRLRRLKRRVAKEILSDPNGDQTKDPAFHEAPWLRIFMGRKLWIQGLGLHSDEVSLRWLLIQRFRYWKRYKPAHRHASGWYVHGPTSSPRVGPLDDQRRWFFESVGLSIIEIAEPEQMYESLFI